MNSLAMLIIFFVMLLGACVTATDQSVLTLESWGNGAPELNLSVPQGYSGQKQKGPDFDVYYITSKDPNDPSMGLYIGHHPNLFSSQRKGIETTKEKDAILGQNVEWIAWEEKQNGKTVYRYETIIENGFKGFKGGGVDRLRIHVFLKGPAQKQVNLLKDSAKSLRIVVK